MDISNVNALGTLAQPTVHTSATSAAATSNKSPAASAKLESASTTAKDALDQALKEVQDALAPVARDLLFSVDHDTGSMVIKIVDSSTEEVIKQIPSEEMLRISKALGKLQGLLLNQTA